MPPGLKQHRIGRKRPLRVCGKANSHRPASPRRSVCTPGDDRLMISQTAVCAKGGSTMEPRKTEKPVKPHSGGLPSPPRQSEERKRRFQIVKLEERIAPGLGSVSHVNKNGHVQNTCICGG